MSDRRHGTRATLPEGYQFGDARFSDPTPAYFAREVMPVIERAVAKGKYFDDRVRPAWRAPHENDAAQLKRNHEHHFDRYDAAYDGLRCMCGALLDAPTVMAQRTGDETV